ncbi:MAG TPA: protein kinase, partial [Gemmataceae bacterium]|nr:protein kinase [Gemmataceae bacterium]
MPHPGPCPSEQNLQRLLLGQLPDPDAERLEEHLGECDSCVQTVSTLKAEDTLAEVIRVQGAAPEMPTTEVVEELMQRMEKLRTSAPETTTATVQLTDTPSGGISVHAASPEGDPRAEAATLPPPAPAAAEATELVYDFLVPAQGPQELGRLGPYRVLKVLGTGGMGVVFEAEDPHLDRLVALKAMLPALASNPLARQRFLREAKAAAAIEHDHIIHINKVGEERGVPFVAMPLLQGESLEDCLRRAAPLPVPEVLRIGREIGAGLAAA